MKTQHWFMVVVILLVGYLLGVWKPKYGAALVSKISGQ